MVCILLTKHLAKYIVVYRNRFNLKYRIFNFLKTSELLSPCLTLFMNHCIRKK